MSTTAKTRRISAGVSLMFTLFASGTLAQPAEVCFDVDLRGGTTEVCADVHNNPAALPWGTTILAVHGFTETAATWQPLAEAMFADRFLRYAVKRVIALDLPGHGDSALPVGLPGGLFGELTVDDNVAVIIQALDQLRAQGLGARAVVGHSMGGLAIQAVQESLLAEGSSLASLGVYRAVLLAPAPPEGQQWTQPPPVDVSPFIVADQPELGAFLAVPPEVAVAAGGFTTWSGTLVSGTPSVEQMANYVGLEPLTTASQIVGEIPLPTVRRGAFAPIHGTLLSLLAFSEDVLVPVDDLDDLYVHLLGRPGLLFRVVESAEAVHNMHMSDPSGLLKTLKRLPLAF